MATPIRVHSTIYAECLVLYVGHNTSYESWFQIIKFASLAKGFIGEFTVLL